jgi:hypothetical protein
MLAGYLTGALICLAAVAAGQAAMALCGARRPSVLAPAVGLSLLVGVADLGAKLHGGATTAGIGLVVLVVTSVVVLAAGWGGRPPAPGPAALVAALLAAFLVSIPFLANGRMGPLGAGLVNDDMASHLLFTDWLITHTGQTPDQVTGGYPLGPHSLVAGVARISGAAPVEVFAGLTFAIAALTALTAFGALDRVRPVLRVPAAALTALPYLGAAWLAQGAFKEPMLAFLLLAFALGLRELDGPRAAIPLGLIAAGTLYLYSFPGLGWLLGAAIAWVALEWWFARGEAKGFELRPLLPAAAVAAGILLLAALPELGRLIDFTSYNAFDPKNVGDRVGLGNLFHPLNPLEAFNVWPSSDFRASASTASIPAPLLYTGALVGIAALAWGLVRAYRRRESALPAGLASGAVVYLAAVAFGTPYTSAKALAILTPTAMLIALRGVRSTPRGRAPTAVATTLAILFVFGAAISSLLPLRAGAVGPNAHADQIESFRPLIDGRRVLFLGREQYVADELIGSKVATPILNYYNQKSIGNRFPPVTGGETVKLDFDAVTPQLLDYYAFAITTSADYQSGAPPNFVPLRRTRDYILWKRTGPTPPRVTLEEPHGPGAVLDCSTPAGRRVRAAGGTATVWPAPPVVGARTDWAPSVRVTDANPSTQELVLPPGRWSISLAYVATQEARLRAPGLDSALPANLDYRGPSPFWPAGELDVRRRGPVRFTLSVDRPPLFGRLIGAEAVAFPLAIAATRAAPPQRIPVGRACGRYVDFIQP